MNTDLGVFTVSGEWMKACGYGDEPRTFEVMRVMEFPGRGEGFERFFKVEMDDGRTWIVAELRGIYLPFHNDLTDADLNAQYQRGWDARMAGEPRYYGIAFNDGWTDADREIRKLEEPGGCGAARVLWTAKSANRKTGPMPVSTSSDETCPDTCPLLKSGACYAKHDRLGQIWRALSAASPGASWKSGVATLRAIDWAGLCERVAALGVGTIWRHNQAGDLPHRAGRILKGRLMALVRANRGRRGFTYTHHDVRGVWNRALVRYANARGFTINLSANNLVEADKLADAFAGPVVVVVPDGVGPKVRATPAGRIVRDCPATYADVTCLKCQWCAMVARDWIVAFPAHGAGAAKVRAIDLVAPHLKR